MERAFWRRLAVLSGLCCATCTLAVVTLAVILSHWHEALNSCTHADCGCLLYARGSLNMAVNGSDVSICWFVTTGPLAGLVVAAAIASVYGYRGYVQRPRSPPALLLVPRGQRAARTSPAHQATKTRALSTTTTVLTVQAVLCMLLALFSVAHVAVLTDGFLSSCREYRHAVLRTLRASGSLALLVNERLSCTVVFDFLDYMKPDVRELIQGDNHWFPGQRKLSTVNTAAALVISLLASYASLALWFVLALQFASRARSTARTLHRAGQARQHDRARQSRLHTTDL